MKFLLQKSSYHSKGARKKEITKERERNERRENGKKERRLKKDIKKGRN